MIFQEKLKSKEKIFLDGGNGSEIARLGGDMSPAFAALATINSPDLVIKVHENFINAGCDIITANTFATNRHNLDSLNRSDDTDKFILKSVELAKKALSNTGKENKIGIAGSLSNFFPLKENEFVPNPKYVPTYKQEEKNYREAAKILKDSGVDILISAPQKGWSSQPCAGLVMMSERARRKIESTESDSFAIDLKKWLSIMEIYEKS